MRQTTNEKKGREKGEKSIVPMPVIDVIQEIMKPELQPLPAPDPEQVRNEVLLVGQSYLVPIMERMAEIACDKSQKVSDAVKAAEFVYSRVLGAPEIKSTHKNFNVDLSKDHLETLSRLSRPFIDMTGDGEE